MDAVERLRRNVDTLIVIPNDRLLSAVVRRRLLLLQPVLTRLVSALESKA